MTDERKRGLYIELQHLEDHYIDWDIILLPPSQTQYTIKNLFPDTKHTIKLRTVGESGIFGPVTTKRVQTMRK